MACYEKLFSMTKLIAVNHLDCTVADNCHGKIFLLTAKSISPRQNQFHHSKINFAAAKSTSSQQNQFRHGKIKMHCVYLNTSINQLRLTLSTLHAKMCCWKHTTSTVRAKHDSWDHEELRHVGLTPIALCELMSRERDSQNDFAVVKMILSWVKFILPWVKMILSWVKLILPWVKLILPYCEIDCAVCKIDFAVLWNWLCRV